MSWFSKLCIKEARRRFGPNDRVRYFTGRSKGTGKDVVFTPSFSRGTIVDFDNANWRYRVKNDTGEEINVHPRNIVPETGPRSLSSPAPASPVIESPSGLGVQNVTQ